MAKSKKKLTKEEKLAKDRLRKRQKYEEIKGNPELYKVQQEKDRIRYLKKKENKKILSIKDMSARAQRDQRKRWRKNTQTYNEKNKKKRELEKILVENSPPESDNDVENEIPPNPNQIILEPDPLSSPAQIKDNSKMTPTSSLRQYRYRSKKVINRLQSEINILKKDKDILRKKVLQQQEILQRRSLEDSVEKKVQGVINDISSGKVIKAKKKLLFDETLTRGLKIKYKELNKSEKRSFAEDIIQPNRARLAKYKLKSKVPFNIRQKLARTQKTQIERKKRLIEEFFEDDANSRMAAGKNEFVKRGPVKKQKRYLNDNLKNLHNKYCKEYGMLSYTVFCRYRPYWVVFPKEDRDTCQCKLHANVDLLIKALHKSKITSDGSSTDVLNSLCCDPYNGNCLSRLCADCKERTLIYNEFDNSEDIDYFEWVIEKQNYRGKNGEQRVKNVTTKKKKMEKPLNIINMLDKIMKLFFKHVHNIVMQQSAIKTLKENLKDTEVLIHVDFSENYCLKFHEEVQSFHFGGSRGQVSLHTVVMYYKHAEKGLSTKSICTMSQCLNHDAKAIWAHIIPVLDTAKQLVPSLSEVHFLSDSPASQYRNRYIFYMITKIHKQVPTVSTVTWNYQEAGHGKGAPDGVGAVLKRTADNYVKFGGDVGSFEEFVDLIREKVKNVDITVIFEEDITQDKFPTHVPSFKGTNKVHQAIWSSELPYTIALRSLSCFSCLNSYLPCKHHKHIGMLDMGFGQTTATNDEENLQLEMPNNSNSHLNNLDMEVDFQFTTKNSNNNLENDNVSTFDIDSDTICNNIEDNMLLSEFDGSLFLSETIPSSPVSATKTEKERPKILSNIIFNYQSYLAQVELKNEPKAQKSSQASHSESLQDFERFLKYTKVQTNDIGELGQGITKKPCLNAGSQVNLTIGNDDTDNGNNTAVDTPDVLDLKYNIDDWVLVKYDISKTRIHFVYYLGKIMDKTHDTHEYKVGFLKRSPGKTMKFAWPSVTDEDIVPESRIIQRLNEPKESRRGLYSFDDLPNFNYE